jgi:hypothetical protein
MEEHFGKDPEMFLVYLKDHKNLNFDERARNKGEVSYAIFGTNCHTFYHSAGDFVATHLNSRELKSLIDDAPVSCTNGYIMGLYKRLGLMNHFETDLLRKFFELCKKGAENQCAHEIGHMLQDKYTYSILKVIDEISKEKYGLVYPIGYDYSIAKKQDLDAPFEGCEEIITDNNKVAQCFTGVGHNLFLFSEFSDEGYKPMIKDCESVEGKNQDNCVGFLLFRIGINEAAPRILSGKVSDGEKVCKDAVSFAQKQSLAFHCYVGIGGGIGLFVDSEYREDDINDQNSELLSEELTNFAKLCHDISEEFVDKCLAGLMGTKYARFYDILKLYDERIEKLRPTLDSDFEVVG